MNRNKILTICIYAPVLGIIMSVLGCNKACQTGYENPNCSVEVRAQFENVAYAVTESRNLDSPYVYTASILADPRDIRKILLTNVANGFFIHNVSAVTNADTMTIAYQSPDTNARYIQGSGILSANVLTISYMVTYPDSNPVLHTQTDYYQSVWVHP
jgi:hypothetical protein